MTKTERTAAIKALKKALSEGTKAAGKLIKDGGRAYQLTVSANGRLGAVLDLLGESIEEVPEEADMVADEAEVSEAE